MSFLSEQIEAVKAFLTDVDPLFIVALVLLFFVGAFMPTILAHFFNRQNRKKVFLANLPAIISWVAWGALLVAAVSIGKDKDEKKPEP